jgi:hypothetical protein
MKLTYVAISLIGTVVIATLIATAGSSVDPCFRLGTELGTQAKLQQEAAKSSLELCQSPDGHSPSQDRRGQACIEAMRKANNLLRVGVREAETYLSHAECRKKAPDFYDSYEQNVSVWRNYLRLHDDWQTANVNLRQLENEE